MTGYDLILQERKRQIEVEGFTSEHDDKYVNGELVVAARCYRGYAMSKRLVDDESVLIHIKAVPDIWPLDFVWWKPKDITTSLVKSGALYLAEADRVERLGRNSNAELYRTIAKGVGSAIDYTESEQTK